MWWPAFPPRPRRRWRLTGPAIAGAIAAAGADDLVLIAGKGHEDYQILGTTKIHFDDREEAEKALRHGLLLVPADPPDPHSAPSPR